MTGSQKFSPNFPKISHANLMIVFKCQATPNIIVVFLWTNFPSVYLDNMKSLGEKCFRAVEHLAIL